jgi:uncharacterized protein (UPF0147 family)
VDAEERNGAMTTVERVALNDCYTTLRAIFDTEQVPLEIREMCIESAHRLSAAFPHLMDLEKRIDEYCERKRM